jgi:hypothetical protein
MTLARGPLDAFPGTKAEWLLRSLGPSTLLAHGFKQHNCDRSGQVQAAGFMHRNADAAIFIGYEQILRKPFCFRAKHEKIIALKSYFVVRTLALCRQKK